MTLWDQVDSNKRRSTLLIFLFVSFIVGLGYLFSYIYGDYSILLIAMFIAIFQSLIGYFAGDAIILATSGAKEIKKSDNPILWNTVENLAITAGLPMPKVYIIADPVPNAFATGRDPKHSSVAVTTGLLERLDKSELQGVIAHEMSHVGNYDIRLTMVVAVLVAVIAILSDIFLRSRWLGLGRKSDNENSQAQGILLLISLLAAILAPIVATLVQLAISRKREFLADSSGALLTRYPEGLASALEKIAAYSAPMQHTSSATAHLYIANPLGGEKEEEEPSYFAKLLSTHPPIKERIKRLRDSV